MGWAGGGAGSHGSSRLLLDEVVLHRGEATRRWTCGAGQEDSRGKGAFSDGALGNATALGQQERAESSCVRITFSLSSVASHLVLVQVQASLVKVCKISGGAQGSAAVQPQCSRNAQPKALDTYLNLLNIIIRLRGGGLSRSADHHCSKQVRDRGFRSEQFQSSQPTAEVQHGRQVAICMRLRLRLGARRARGRLPAEHLRWVLRDWCRRRRNRIPSCMP